MSVSGAICVWALMLGMTGYVKHRFDERVAVWMKSEQEKGQGILSTHGTISYSQCQRWVCCCMV
ncbi:MAG: hypothetical protein KAG53_10870 [Endozoicomonadaceae bacterium]|nr:hypothetical protein [Endozoicomonadaceae bacterium]